MKDIINYISQGVYVLTTNGGGCIVDAVSQVSSDDMPLISVAVMKKNYTNQLLQQNKLFCISVLSERVNPSIINKFGMHSMKDFDKFDGTDIIKVNDINVITDSIGYMLCEIVEVVDTNTHNLYIARVIKKEILKNEKELTYNYYQDHKEDYVKVKINGKTAWICTICGYIYYGEEIPDDFKCPICGVGKELFEQEKH